MSSKNKLVLLGGGGYAAAIIDCLDGNDYELVGIVEKSGADISATGDVPIVGDDDSLVALAEGGVTHAVVAVGHTGSWKVRSKLYSNILNAGLKPAKIIHKTAVVSHSAKIGIGTVILAGAFVGANAVIGENCVINTHAIVEHGCKIADGVHFAPRSAAAGDVTVGKNSFIGLGACVIQGIKIGEGCLIGAGSVVIRDIPDNSIAYGVPAKAKERKEL